MLHRNSVTSQSLTHDERAFFARLAAINTAFESARAGAPAQSFGHRALASDAILEAFLQDIQTKKAPSAQ